MRFSHNQDQNFRNSMHLPELPSWHHAVTKDDVTKPGKSALAACACVEKDL